MLPRFIYRRLKKPIDLWRDYPLSRPSLKGKRVKTLSKFYLRVQYLFFDEFANAQTTSFEEELKLKYVKVVKGTRRVWLLTDGCVYRLERWEGLGILLFKDNQLVGRVVPPSRKAFRARGRGAKP